jgi:hypothetical protein
MAFQIKSDILLQFFLCLSMLMTSQSSVTDNIKNTLENKSNNFCQSFTIRLIVGYVFSLSLYCYAVHQSKKKKKNNHLNKAKELVKYICFITRRRKQMVVSQMHKLINFRQIRKESKEVLYYYFFLFK